mgnify:CR=1 FL=1
MGGGSVYLNPPQNQQMGRGGSVYLIPSQNQHGGGGQDFQKTSKGGRGVRTFKKQCFRKVHNQVGGGGDLSSFKTTVPKKLLGASENIYSGGSGNPIRSSPGRSNSILLIQSRSVQLNPIRSHPTQSNPVQSKPIQSNTTQSNPTQCNTRQHNPIPHSIWLKS